MARTIEYPDFICTEPTPIAACLPLKGSYFTIVSRDGSIFRLHRSRVAWYVSDASGRITEIALSR
jgi:hypothetical protein